MISNAELTMNQYFKESLLSKLKKKNRLSLIPYYTKIKNDIEFINFSNKVINVISEYANLNGDDEDYIVRVYDEYYLEYLELQKEFQKSGKYKYNSFATLNNELNSEFHKDYIYVLLLSFLTTSYRYEMMNYISNKLDLVLNTKGEIGIEIGFGTGIDLLSRINRFDLYDIYEINEYSKRMFDLLYQENKITNYNYSFYQFEDIEMYSFVQLIELMEHLENPKSYIDLSHKILKKDGILLFSSAVNMANIDHIYLFNNLESVRTLIDEDKWDVIDEKCFVNSLLKYPDDKIQDIIDKNKAPYIVLHLLKKK